MNENIARHQRIERSDLEAFLARLEHSDGPKASNIMPRDRPDFRVTVAGADIGVEISRNVPQEVMVALRLQASDHPNSWVNLTHLADRDGMRRGREVIRGVSLSIESEWKPSMQRWREWKEKNAHVITKKRRRLNTPGFEKYSRNWLLVVDCLGLLDVSDYEQATRCLAEIFSTPCPDAEDYDVIYVHSEQLLFRYASGELHCDFDCNWRRPSAQLV
jgi:hypothetical protein